MPKLQLLVQFRKCVSNKTGARDPLHRESRVRARFAARWAEEKPHCRSSCSRSQMGSYVVLFKRWVAAGILERVPRTHDRERFQMPRARPFCLYNQSPKADSRLDIRIVVVVKLLFRCPTTTDIVSGGAEVGLTSRFEKFAFSSWHTVELIAKSQCQGQG